MPEVFDYAVVQVVPRVERGEAINVGVIVSCPTVEFLAGRFTADLQRVAVLAPDLDLHRLARHLEGLQRICAGDPAGGPVAQLPARERFHWLTHPRSTIVQTSAVHSGRTDDPREALDRLMATMVD